MHTATALYRRHRFPAEIINHCVWLPFRFALSFRDVEEIMAMRGVTLSYEAIREWCLKFGQTYANELRRKRPRPGDKWHLDEMFIKIRGKDQYLWRGGGPRWQRPGHPGSESKEQKGRQAVLPQATEGLAVCAARHHHR